MSDCNELERRLRESLRHEAQRLRPDAHNFWSRIVTKMHKKAIKS